MYALKEENDSQEIIEIGEKILAQCTDNAKRYSAMQVLCFLYKKLGDREKAKEYAYMAPNLVVTNNVLLSHVLEGDELAVHCQNNIVVMLDLLAREIFRYGSYRGGIKGNEAKHAMRTATKLYELIYENGDFGFYACRLSEIYENLAKIAAEQQNKDETLEYLANTVKYTIIFDTQEEFQRTSLLVNRLSYSSKNVSKDYMANESYLTLKQMEDKCYDFCRGDERFVKLIEDLKKVAKEDASV